LESVYPRQHRQELDLWFAGGRSDTTVASNLDSNGLIGWILIRVSSGSRPDIDETVGPKGESLGMKG
jgi:hypothetical protein